MRHHILRPLRAASQAWTQAEKIILPSVGVHHTQKSDNRQYVEQSRQFTCKWMLNESLISGTENGAVDVRTWVIPAGHVLSTTARLS